MTDYCPELATRTLTADPSLEWTVISCQSAGGCQSSVSAAVRLGKVSYMERHNRASLADSFLLLETTDNRPTDQLTTQNLDPLSQTLNVASRDSAEPH